MSDDILDDMKEEQPKSRIVGADFLKENEHFKRADDVLKTRARMINFGAEFDKWEPQRQIKYLKNLASAMNHAADVIQGERNALATEVETLKKQLENADKNVQNQKTILINAITENNRKSDEMGAIVQNLEGDIKKKETIIKELHYKLEILRDRLEAANKK